MAFNWFLLSRPGRTVLPTTRNTSIGIAFELHRKLSAWYTHLCPFYDNNPLPQEEQIPPVFYRRLLVFEKLCLPPFVGMHFDSVTAFSLWKSIKRPFIGQRWQDREKSFISWRKFCPILKSTEFKLDDPLLIEISLPLPGLYIYIARLGVYLYYDNYERV